MSRSFVRPLGMGLVIAASLVMSVADRAGAADAETLGTGPAYARLGELAVMHEGRIKPLDTVAREEVKHIHGRETLKIHDSSGKVLQAWGPVGAFLDWTVRPEAWEDQPFILVDYLPLRRLLLEGLIRARLKEIASKGSTPREHSNALEALAAEPSLSGKSIRNVLAATRLPQDDQEELRSLAARLGEEHKWLSPRELDEARIERDGRQLSFMEWVAELDSQKRRFDADPNSTKRLTETERRAIDVGRRFVTYRAYTGEELRPAGIVRVVPRPSNTKALGYVAQVIKKAREARNLRDLSPIEFDTLKALDTFWNDTPRDERHEPGQNAAFDAKFSRWLRESSVWVPLKVILKSETSQLVEAGFPEAEIAAFLTSYRALEAAELSSPGHLSPDVAAAVVATSRALGEAVSPMKFPTVAEIERETHFNAMNPFWQAPIAYGAALLLLVLSLGFVRSEQSISGQLGRWLYRLGLVALAGGIALEVYGFYLRVRISGWAPVTNMYETVIWVALVAAVLAFIFELIYRKTFPAVAGAAVALLGTITAVNVPLLDPSIRSLVPVLRSNFWLTIHVLTIVSSYAAFGLAWALGLIAMGYYLTATYRRSPRVAELALPLVPGLPLLIVGSSGVAASYGVFGEQWSTGDFLFYVFALMGGVGGMISLGAILALAGELVNRLRIRSLMSRESARAETVGASWESDAMAGRGGSTVIAEHGGVATLVRSSVAELRGRSETGWEGLDFRSRAMQETASTIKPLSNFIYRAMQVGVLLIAAGTILGGVWADYSWGRFWGWDAKEVWALITLLVYLVPLHGRFAGWVNTFGLSFASVVCFLSVIMAWYGVNFVLGVGLHSYGFVDGGSQGMMSVIIAAMLSIPVAAWWRRNLASQATPASV